MKPSVKNILTGLLIFLIWSLGNIIFKFDAEFYNLLKLPAFSINFTITNILYIIVYILVSLSILIISKKTNILKNYDYLYVLITNYLASMFYPFMFFNLKSPFFGFIMSAIIFISSIFLFIETKIIDKKTSFLLIPYIIFNVFTLILSMTIYVMNF